MKFLIYDTTMKHKIGTEISLSRAIRFLNGKDGNIVQTMDNEKDFYKAFGVSKGKIKASIRYTAGKKGWY